MSTSGTPAAMSPLPGAMVASLPPPPLDALEELNEKEKRKWVKGKKLGEGTYANVFLGHSRTNPGLRVAIKKIKVQKEYQEGMAPDAVREVKFLQELRHDNIIRLLGVFNSKDQNLCLVLEFLPRGDLETLLHDQDNVIYSGADIKAWMGMLLRGVWFCHENWVLHRDIKPNNLLIAADGEVKLADFGLARYMADPWQVMTSNVITRWYRPPELFFGARHYSGAVDIWSVGCVFAELCLRRAWMPGGSDNEMVTLIHNEVGHCVDEVWPGVSTLPFYVGPSATEGTPPLVRDANFYRAKFGALGAEGCDLLMQMMHIDPKKRISARNALKHKWWFVDPRPTRKEDLPRAPDKKKAERQMVADLKRGPGVLGSEESGTGRGLKVARKLDFGAAK